MLGLKKINPPALKRISTIRLAKQAYAITKLKK